MATATGHHYANFEKAKDVLEIDISFLKSIAVNKDDNTITIGGAVKFGEVTNPLYEVEKEMRR